MGIPKKGIFLSIDLDNFIISNSLFFEAYAFLNKSILIFGRMKLKICIVSNNN
jgi:hypothetical protein